jgi:hypothetical protein
MLARKGMAIVGQAALAAAATLSALVICAAAFLVVLVCAAPFANLRG